MEGYVATCKSSEEPGTTLKLIKFSNVTKIYWRKIKNVIERVMNNLAKLSQLTSVRPAFKT